MNSETWTPRREPSAPHVRLPLCVRKSAAPFHFACGTPSQIKKLFTFSLVLRSEWIPESRVSVDGRVEYLRLGIHISNLFWRCPEWYQSTRFRLTLSQTPGLIDSNTGASCVHIVVEYALLSNKSDFRFFCLWKLYEATDL